jgi:hypothetical protein
MVPLRKRSLTAADDADRVARKEGGGVIDERPRRWRRFPGVPSPIGDDEVLEREGLESSSFNKVISSSLSSLSFGGVGVKVGVVLVVVRLFFGDRNAPINGLPFAVRDRVARGDITVLVSSTLLLLLFFSFVRFGDRFGVNDGDDDGCGGDCDIGTVNE